MAENGINNHSTEDDDDDEEEEEDDEDNEQNEKKDCPLLSVDEDSSSKSEDKSLEDKTDEDKELQCPICHQLFVEPKFLSCTHTFCLTCINQSANNNNNSGQEQVTIECPECGQVTEVPNVSSLLDDFVRVRALERRALRHGSVFCTACTSGDRAVGHCSSCTSYLCAQCCQAHQYMKCFEQHRVRLLTDLLNNDELFDETTTTSGPKCSQHNRCEIRFFCTTCSIPLCGECLPNHPQNEHDVHPSQLEQIRADLGEKLERLGEMREVALTRIDNQLTHLQRDYDLAKTQIDLAHLAYQQALSKVYTDCLSSLTDLQRDEEMRLLDQLERVQKGSQSFDDSRPVVERCLARCPLNELVQLKAKLFDKQLNYLQELLQHKGAHFQQQETPTVQFLPSSTSDFEHLLKQNFGQLTRPQQIEVVSSPSRTTERASLLTPNDRSVSSSSGVGSSGVAPLSSARTVISNGASPERVVRIEPTDDYFFNCSSSNAAPVAENLRALESIFSGSTNESKSPSSMHPNVQRNLEQMLQLNQQQHQHQHQQQQQQQHDNPFTILTRQTSAPIGQRSPSNGVVNMPPPSMLSSGLTFSSTNSGGSSNGNNSRSTTPFSNIIQNSNAELNGHGGSTPQQPSIFGIGQSALLARRGQCMQVRSKFGSLGPQKAQFNAPHGFCLGIDEEIIVADTNNHRIQIFEKNGEYKYQFGMPGREEGQLWYPRKVAVMRQSGKFVICDRGNERSRMQIFTRSGHFIKKISIRYIDIVAGLAITPEGNIVAVDSVSPTVFCISESGDLLKWFDCSDFMREPSDIAIYNNEYFVCDFKGHCVVVFDEDGGFLRRIGAENITNFPNGIDISDAGDVIIGDSHGNRFHIAVFTRSGDFLQEFDCPYVKVSRCCGLKITSDGFIVTLAKNNHHVLVLNTLYLT